ncbi:uncharacterized protein LOC127715844 [Mytilus californianus]|uniref:uncharacterized protein LOC127715844 n=1 Tax=Mytilus californianus TaxID=6549 RepID=UPI002246D52C|nr:uncharacterized protein LOC127715844 [Mytilus californianus]
MMMPVKMADGRMMNMIEMLMMKPTVANPPTTATTTTRKPPDPCVPRCPAGYVQVPDQSVSNKCFRAGRGQASFTAADAECSETTNANLWCPGSIAEDRSVRSKLKLGTETLRIGCNDQDKDASYTCKGTERKCDPKNPSFGEKAEGTAGCSVGERCDGDEKGYCVNIAFDGSSKDKKKWLLVECNSENLFVCEVPIIPC